MKRKFILNNNNNDSKHLSGQREPWRFFHEQAVSGKKGNIAATKQSGLFLVSLFFFVVFVLVFVFYVCLGLPLPTKAGRGYLEQIAAWRGLATQCHLERRLVVLRCFRTELSDSSTESAARRLGRFDCMSGSWWQGRWVCMCMCSKQKHARKRRAYRHIYTQSEE